MQPSGYFLIFTVMVTAAASVVLCVAIMTNNWEMIEFDRARVEEVTRSHNDTHSLLWLFDGAAARVSISRPAPLRHRYVMEATRLRRSVRGRREATSTVAAAGLEADDQQQQQPPTTVSNVFLVPLKGGLWTLCVDLDEDQRHELQTLGFTEAQCIHYLSADVVRLTEGKAVWQHRMQNLSISCALVCLIILGSSIVVGFFGVFKHQISAVLVTGVMYLLAATFAMFTLVIMHFKRQNKKGCSLPEVVRHIAPEYYNARVFSNGWSLELGWVGVMVCVFASGLWLLLSKIMRYNPLVSLLSS